MKQKIKAILDDDRGVSPVIGVILMVAITVILAAVIGTFVLGLGDSLQQAPQSQISVEDASVDFQVDNSSNEDAFVISQEGGDQLTMGDLRIVFSPVSSSGSTTFETGSYTVSESSSTIALQKGGTTVDDSTKLGVGEQLVLTQTADDGGTETGGVFTDDTDYEVQIIHVPSDSIIKEATVTLQ